MSYVRRLQELLQSAGALVLSLGFIHYIDVCIIKPIKPGSYTSLRYRGVVCIFFDFLYTILLGTCKEDKHDSMWSQSTHTSVSSRWDYIVKEVANKTYVAIATTVISFLL